MTRSFIVTALIIGAVISLAAQPVPLSGVWPASRVRPILERTARTRLSPDLSHLSTGEHIAVSKLLEVGAIFQDIYEQQRHRSALQQRAALARATDVRSRDLLTLYRLNAGPIATTLENTREPFLAVDPPPPGKNVYPWDLTEKKFQTYLAAHPEARPTLTHLRHVVRRADASALTRDLGVLTKHPVLDTLHPGLRPRSRAWRKDRTAQRCMRFPTRWRTAINPSRRIGCCRKRRLPSRRMMRTLRGFSAIERAIF